MIVRNVNSNDPAYHVTSGVGKALIAAGVVTEVLPTATPKQTGSLTLQLREDAEGLHYSCDLPNTQAARDLHESIKRGDIKGCSFAFKLQAGEDDSYSQIVGDDGEPAILRTIHNVRIVQDVSPVTYPAYDGTFVDARFKQVSVEVRQRITKVRRDFDRLRKQLPKFEDVQNELRLPVRKARRKALLDQV